MTLTLTNVSGTPIVIDPWPGNWFVQVFDERMNVIGPKTRAVDVSRPAPKPATLQPGERWDATMSGWNLTTGLADGSPLWEYDPLPPGTYWLGADYTALADPRHPGIWSGRINCQLVKIDAARSNKLIRSS